MARKLWEIFQYWQRLSIDNTFILEGVSGVNWTIKRPCSGHLEGNEQALKVDRGLRRVDRRQW